MSNNIEQIEFIGVATIIVFQVLIFLTTRKRISIYKGVFPTSDKFEIRNLILKKKYVILHPNDVLKNLEDFQEDSIDNNDENNPDDELYQLDIIIHSEGNEVTQKIADSLNTYLIRNRGVASDFNLIKDVVERNSNSVEDQIQLTMSLPLYLGLLGTFIGIVFGLFQISGVDFASDSVDLGSPIGVLLGGVRIAMIASFTGLLLTIINSGYSFRKAKVIVEDNKNEFFTFIQVELLPLLNQSMNSTLISLQNNLFKFNDDFKGSVTYLSNVIGKNREAIDSQSELINMLKNIDLNQFAEANVTILQQLKVSVHEFSQFNKYLTGMVSMVQHTEAFAGKLDSIIERTDNFHELGAKIVATFQENAKLQGFLQNHYSALDESRQLIVQSVGGVNNIIDESLRDLKEFTQAKLAEIKKISLHEMDLMQNQYPEKWKNLDHLKSLKVLTEDFHNYKSINQGQNESLRVEMSAIKDELNGLSDKIIRRIERKNWFVRKIEKLKK